MTNDPSLDSVVARTMPLARKILAAHGLERDFHPDDGLVDVGLTSLDLVNLMVAVEGEFDLLIPPALINPQNFRSVATIARAVAAVLAQDHASA